MQYNKLVRDKIPERIRSKGEAVSIHIADDQEYWEKLKEKLSEEIIEFIDSETVEELADILEVIDAICDYKNFNISEIKEIKDKKTAERGAFKQRIILEEA